MNSSRFAYLFSCVCICIVTAITFLHPIADMSQDLGRHLLLGKLILQTHTVPQINFFSYTYPTFPFINSHWLSEVVFYLLSQAVGLYGLFYVTVALFSLAFTALFAFAAKRFGIFPAFVSTVFVLTIFLSRTVLRPEIFSYVFMAVFLIILYKHREKPTKWLFLLPLVQAAWVNMHIYFPVGEGLVGLFVLDTIVTRLHQTHAFSGVLYDKRLRLLVLTLVLCFLATLINPNGITGALYPLHVFANYGYSIEENQSIFFLLNYGFPFSNFAGIFVATGILILLAIVYRSKLPVIDVLLAVILTIGAFSATRNSGLYALGIIMLLIRLVSSLFISLSKRLNEHSALLFFGKSILCCFLVIVLFWLRQTTDGFALRIDATEQNATDFFLTHELKGPLFNNFDIGSYLDYRLYPREKVFVDGRPEAYPVDFFQNVYIPMQENPQVFNEEDAKYHFNTIIFSYTDQTPWAAQFVFSINKNTTWKLVYLDPHTMILVKKTPQNHDLIRQFEIVQNNAYTTAVAGKHYSPQQLKQVAIFFQETGWVDAEISTLEQYLQQPPSDCVILRILAQLYGEKGNATRQANMLQQYQTFCQ